MTLLISVLEQGLVYALMALGVYITYKILDFPDLTVDGSFPFGAALTAVLITKGVNPFWTLPLSFAGGLLIGVLTGLIHVKLRVRDLLSGIIMMTGLYTVNLRIAGKANVPIYNMDTIFDNGLVSRIFPEALAPFRTVLLLVVVVAVSKGLLDLYMGTQSGYLLRAVGDNDTLVTTLAIDKGKVKIIGLAIANGLVSLGGCVYAQQQRFFDISMGTGTVVIGLASVIIGLSLFKRGSLFMITLSVVVGAILYKGCVAAALRFGLNSSDLKLVTAVLFLVILVVTTDRKGSRDDRA